jgi:hypothetical protein
VTRIDDRMQKGLGYPVTPGQRRLLPKHCLHSASLFTHLLRAKDPVSRGHRQPRASCLPEGNCAVCAPTRVFAKPSNTASRAESA